MLNQINPEDLAIKLINSNKIKFDWKRDFKRDLDAKGDWDLINSEGMKIEVKSTSNEYRYNGNYFTLHFPNQEKQIIFFLFIKNNRIKEYKFLKKNKGIWGEWKKNG